VRRLVADQLVALSVGDATIDCRVAVPSAEEAGLVPIHLADGRRLPTASGDAELVFSHEGQLIMLRGAIYRGACPEDILFAERRTARPAAVAEQRRRAARLPIALPATVTALDAAGRPADDQRQLLTRDVSIGGFAVVSPPGGLSSGTTVRFELVLGDGAIIAGTARVARSTGDVTGLAFVELPPLERVRLGSFLARQSARAPLAGPAGTGGAPGAPRAAA
jgi:hypothetical protein